MTVRIWHVAVFALALAISGAALAPASLVVPRQNPQFAFERADGSVWSGRLLGARIGPYAVSELSWRILPLAALGGQVRAAVRMTGAIEGAAEAGVGLGAFRELRSNAITIDGLTLGGALVAGQTRAENLHLAFKQGACTAAAGRVTSGVLREAGRMYGFEAPEMAGDAACEGRDVLIRLRGASAGAQASADLRLAGDGAAEWRLSVTGVTTQAQGALRAAGFTLDPGASALVRIEQFRWLPL